MTKKIKLSLVACLLTTAATANEDLGTITVTSATKSEQSIKDVTSNVNVITGEELEEKHVTTVAEALNLVSGINTTSNGGLGQPTSIYLRGFSASRVLILIDGIRYNDLTNGSAFLENILVSDIKQIEIIKGAQSGIWGADASGGVINIITKTPQDGFSGTLNAEYGSFNTKKYGTSLSYKTEKYYAKINAQRVTSDGFSAQAPKGVDLDSLEDDSYENTTLSLKTGVNIDDNNKIDLSHTIIDSEVEYDGTDADDASQYSTSKSKFSKINFNHINNFNKIDLYANRSSFKREYPNDFTKVFKGKIEEYGLKSTIPYNTDDIFIIGVDYKKFEQTDSVDNDYSNKSAFATNSNKFDKLVLTQSLRVDNYDTFDDKTTGKIGAKYNFTDDFTLFSNIGTGYNIPTLAQLYGGWGANPNLNPETTKSYDIGFEYKDLKVTYFYNKIEDMIDWDGSGYENIDGESTFKGIEIDYKKEIIDDLALSLNYTRVSAKDDDNEDLIRRAKQTAKLGLDYYGIKKLHLGINAQYIGERKDTRFNADWTTTEVQTGRYTIANFVTNYQVTEDLKVYAKIDNITDKYYQTVEGYSTSPRAYYAGVKYSF